LHAGPHDRETTLRLWWLETSAQYTSNMLVLVNTGAPMLMIKRKPVAGEDWRF